MDILLYDLTGRFSYVDGLKREETENAGADSRSSASRLEVICGKVMKYLLTYRGTDAFDPSYGGRALHRTTISKTLAPQIRIELVDDIRDCIEYLVNAEEDAGDDVERLRNVSLVGFSYNPKADPTRLDIHLLIETTYGNAAVINTGV